MTSIISPTGFWIEYEDYDHVFIEELSNVINDYVKEHQITTVYDFGCGTGEYLDRLTKEVAGITATGFEGSPNNTIYNNVVKKDLSSKLNLEPVDLVISIEVGEHIPKEFEQNFIDNISNSSKKHIIFSWAIEGQNGTGHINCQNNDYIISEMEKRGWKFDTDKTISVRDKMPPIWIKNTVMFFNK